MSSYTHNNNNKSIPPTAEAIGLHFLEILKEAASSSENPVNRARASTLLEISSNSTTTNGTGNGTAVLNGNGTAVLKGNSIAGLNVSHLPTEITSALKHIQNQASGSSASAPHHPLKSASLLGGPEDIATKIMNTLYNEVLGPLTYVPPGSVGMQPMINPQTEFLQISTTGYPISADSVNDIWSSGNVHGSKTDTEYFTSLVDVDKSFTTTYRDTLEAVTASSESKDPEKEALLQKAKDYLQTWIDVTDMNGQVKKMPQYTPIFADYQKKKAAYNNAVAAFRGVFDSYDMTDKKDQRSWMAQQPILQNEVDRTLDEYRLTAPFVEQAQNVINAFSTATLSSSIIAAAKRDFDATEMPSLFNAAQKWHPIFPVPYNFAKDDSGFSNRTVSNSRSSQSSSHESEQWSGGASWSYGLWSVGGGTSGSNERTSSHAENTTITIQFKTALVRLDRPWLHESLFKIGGWYVNGATKGVISDGQNSVNNKGTIPSYRTGVIIAKDLTITGDFDSKDAEMVEKIRQGSTSVGFGPFSVGGSYKKQNRDEKVEVYVDKTSIRVPGMQIIGWLNSFVPLAPQMNDPKLH